jgi:hypothetical protein
VAQPIPNPTNTVPGGPVVSSCSWTSSVGSIVLDLTVFPDTESAQQTYEYGVQYAHQSSNGVTFHSAQTVTGVGQKATAVFQTVTIESGSSPAVELYVWSGNAQFQVSFTDLSSSSGPSRATLLAADIAMARDVLRSLPS